LSAVKLPKVAVISHVLSFFRAGSKLTVIDNSDKDWWKGKCLGAVGVFPSTYVTKLQTGEKPLQVSILLKLNKLVHFENTAKKPDQGLAL
jgi:hypothetical protein